MNNALPVGTNEVWVVAPVAIVCKFLDKISAHKCRETRLTEEGKSIGDLHENMPGETFMTSLVSHHETRQISPFAVVIIRFKLLVRKHSPAVAIVDPGMIWDDV